MNEEMVRVRTIGGGRGGGRRRRKRMKRMWRNMRKCS
jgi:hypothetical protein